MGRGTAARAAIGIRAHSGWAALVAVGESARDPEAFLRIRIEIADPTIPGSKQPYHEAEGLDVEKAGRLLARMENGSKRLANLAIGDVLERIRESGHDIAGCALLLASGRPLPGLESILASHALIHAADGEHFRNALVEAAAAFGIPVTRIREKELFAIASKALKRPEDDLRRIVAEMGKPLGPPWGQDQKLAALAGWVALAGRGAN